MMPSARAPGLISLGESRELASAVAHAADLALVALEERQFAGGEFKLRPLESVRDRELFVLQSLAGTAEAPVSSRLVRLLFLLQGLRDAGARCTVLVPYLAFARKDVRTQLRDPVNSRYVAELIEAAGPSRVVGLDVHNPAAFDNAFRIPTDHLSALPMMVDHLASRFLGGASVTVVSPDVGGIKRAQILRERLSARLGRAVEIAFVEKRRANDVVSSGALAGNVNGREAIVVDDLCATGGTLIRAAEACRRAKALTVHVAVTHAPLFEGLEALLAAEAISSVIVTDSVAAPYPSMLASSAPDRLTVLSIAPLFGQAIRRTLDGKTMAPLLERWPVAPDE
jgi:ribose-phosphate pyrophosphokinase